jgi:hypothetical protein
MQRGGQLGRVEVAHGLHGDVVPIKPVLHKAGPAGGGRNGRGVNADFALQAGDDFLPPITQAIGNGDNAAFDLALVEPSSQ